MIVPNLIYGSGSCYLMFTNTNKMCVHIRIWMCVSGFNSLFLLSCIQNTTHANGLCMGTKKL